MNAYDTCLSFLYVEKLILGGWNNIRMAMETVMTMAVAMGRTLVLPPEQHMYLLDKGNSQRKHFSFVRAPETAFADCKGSHKKNL